MLFPNLLVENNSTSHYFKHKYTLYYQRFLFRLVEMVSKFYSITGEIFINFQQIECGFLQLVFHKFILNSIICGFGFKIFIKH